MSKFKKGFIIGFGVQGALALALLAICGVTGLLRPGAIPAVTIGFLCWTTYAGTICGLANCTEYSS